MDDFLRFFDSKVHDFPMHLEITYSRICDYCIRIYKRNCSIDYPDARHDGYDVIIANVQSSDMELCFAMAQVALKEWLLEFEGGY